MAPSCARSTAGDASGRSEEPRTPHRLVFSVTQHATTITTLLVILLTECGAAGLHFYYRGEGEGEAFSLWVLNNVSCVKKGINKKEIKSEDWENKLRNN